MTPRSLSSFLARMIGWCMAPLLALAVGLAWHSLREQEARHLRQGADLAKNFTIAIDQRLQARIGALNMLANSPLADDPRRWPELYAEAQGFLTSFGSHVIFADTARHMLFNTRSPFGTALPMLPLSNGRSAAPMALATGRPQVGDIVMGPVAHRRLVAVVVPSLRDGRPTHLMLTTLEATSFQERIDAIALPMGCSIALQDSTGAVIARRSPLDFNAARDVDADHRFVAHLTQSHWTVVVEIPRATHWERKSRTLAFLAAALVLATLLGRLGGVLASRRLTRQVAVLAAPTDATTPPLDIAEIETARMRLLAAAAAREASESRFSRLFHEAPMPLCFVDRAGVLVDRNRRFDQVFGYDHEELRSLADWWRLAYPDPGYRARVLETWSAAVAEAANTGADIAPIEYTVTCKDGTQCVMLISGIALGEDFLATFFDITERKRAEQAVAVALEAQKQGRLEALSRMEDATAARRETEIAAAALRESRERLQLLIDHAPAALAMFGRDMRYLAVSRRWKEDYALGERDLTGLSHYEVFPEIGEDLKAVHRRALSGEIVRAEEDRFIRADGREQWLRWEVRPWHEAEGGIGGIVIFSEDITGLTAARHEIVELNAGLERRVIERTAELTAANQELDSFAYAVSHDLRAPLRAMRGFAQALQEDFGDTLTGEARSYLDQIGIASRRMGDLIEGILTLSRSTRSEVRRDAVDLTSMARRRLQERAEETPELRVTATVDEGLMATGDERMLEAALGNLIDNAWKYSAKTTAPVIRVYAEERQGRRWFCVADNGAGFDMTHAARLFQPFQRLHRQDEFPGIGIGLATVARIVHRHGGEIEARGAVGSGATFCFRLDSASNAE